jgi:hypothetical protein
LELNDWLGGLYVDVETISPCETGRLRNDACVDPDPFLHRRQDHLLCLVPPGFADLHVVAQRCAGIVAYYAVDPDDVQVHVGGESAPDHGRRTASSRDLDDVPVGQADLLDVAFVDPGDAPADFSLVGLRHLQP